MSRSQFEEGCEVQDLTVDYLDFLQHLKNLNNPERPTLREFAVWRNEEFEARGEYTNPIPSIH